MPAIKPDFDFREDPRCIPCPQCGRTIKKHKLHRRVVVDIQNGKVIEVRCVVGNYECQVCQRYFTHCPTWARRGSPFSKAFVKEALAIYHGPPSLTLEKAAIAFQKKYDYRISYTTLHDWIVEETANGSQAKIEKVPEAIR